MGLRNLGSKQIIKGLTFLFSEFGIIYFMFVYGINNIRNLISLGSKAQSWKFDYKLGFEIRVIGDNSMLLLLFGISTIIICVGAILMWSLNIKSAGKIDKIIRNKGHIPSFLEEMHDFFDRKFHITLLTIPLTSVLFFTVLPVIYMISIAFTSYDHKHLPPRHLFDWVGFSNFGNVLTGNMSTTFFPLLLWTITWAAFATFSCFIFGVALAVLLNSKGIYGKQLLRTMFVLTMAVPSFISLLVMRNLLHSSGPINTFLLNLDIITNPIPFLTNNLWAKVSVIVVNMWIGIPASMLVTTGILLNLSNEQIEAAKIDGATPIQIFRHITFPQILTVMTPSLIQQFVVNINNFNVIYLLTEGLPYNSNYYGAGETDLLVTWLYKLTVNNADYNLAAVIGIFIFSLSAVFSLFIYTRTNSYKN